MIAGVVRRPVPHVLIVEAGGMAKGGMGREIAEPLADYTEAVSSR